MAATHEPGFVLLKGPRDTFYSTVSSTATFLKGVVVTYSDDRTLIEAASDSTAVVGVAMHDAADSLPGAYSGKCLVQKILPNQTWVCQAVTGLGASALSAGEAVGLSKSGNYLRVDSSGATLHAVIVPRDDGATTCNSADSSIHVQFLADVCSPFASTQSISVFAEN